MMLPEALGDAGSSKIGLTGGQKASAIGRLFPKPKTSHPYVVGLSLVVIGGFSLVGSITGKLPSMLAALFDPNALVDSSGNTALGVLIDPSQTGIPKSGELPAIPPVTPDSGGQPALPPVPELPPIIKLPDIPLELP